MAETMIANKRKSIGGSRMKAPQHHFLPQPVRPTRPCDKDKEEGQPNTSGACSGRYQRFGCGSWVASFLFSGNVCVGVVWRNYKMQVVHPKPRAKKTMGERAAAEKQVPVVGVVWCSSDGVVLGWTAENDRQLSVEGTLRVGRLL
jgi:hypothetical protein